MTARFEDYDRALDRAALHSRSWLSGLPDRPIGPRATADELLTRLGAPLPDGPSDPADVVDLLAELAEPGLMAIGSGRFYGWVMGGTLPAALAADWLVSAWDQNSGMRESTPGTVAAEEAAGSWLLDLLGLPADADVGFVTGATMANFAGLAAARQQVLADAGWDLNRDGLFGAPPVRVLVGAERHDTVDLALRYLGLGSPTVVPADPQGRLRVDALATELERGAGPTIVCLQAGNVHSGAFDPIGAASDLAHTHGAWAHVDGAFGLWAAASPTLRALMPGYEAADSWATDAHKTLNSPYDCGIAIVAHPAPLRAALGVHASYLVPASAEAGNPYEKVSARRSRTTRARARSWPACSRTGPRGCRDPGGTIARSCACR